MTSDVGADKQPMMHNESIVQPRELCLMVVLAGAEVRKPPAAELSAALFGTPEEAREMEVAAVHIQAAFRGYQSRHNHDSYRCLTACSRLLRSRLNRRWLLCARSARRRKRLRNRKHGRDPPKFKRKGKVRRGAVWENSTRYGNGNRHGMRALLGQVTPTATPLSTAC